MENKKKGLTSDWKKFSELRLIHQDISEMGYKKEYIKKHNLSEAKSFRWTDSMAGAICYYEPIEVTMGEEKILWRYNVKRAHREIPEVFVTQLGNFNNHNHGEFTSWLEKKKETNGSFGQGGFSVEGNYCDMFDCGEYVYAVSNLMHMGLGTFKIIRIDKNLGVETIYENYLENEHTLLEYLGRYKNADGYVVVVSGMRESRYPESESEFQNITILFQIDEKGNCYASSEWEIYISSANSIVVDDDYIYFGQNKMVTRLKILTGEIDFFTNKTDEELAVLVDVW